MRKVRVWKDDFTGSWRVQSGSLLLDPDSVAARCPTHAEAMFLAQLLADPHEYIRAAQERAWEAGFGGGEKDAFSHQTFDEPCIPNPYRMEHRMITPETDPWANQDAANAAGYARWHADARAAWEADKTPGLANAITRIQNIREVHQSNTGWVAEPLGQGRWRFVYMDPKTLFTGGQPVTITTKERP